MNERIQELLDAVQRTACEVTGVASDAAYGVGKKATELLSVAKLNIRLNETRAEITDRLKAVGEMMYATHTGTPTDSETLLASLQEIDGLQARAAELEAEIARLRGQERCPACGGERVPGDVYCRHCGARL